MIVVLNVVGLTPRLIPHAPRIMAAVDGHSAWTSPLPAVTCTSQATMLTGQSPQQHGIVGNGWYFRDTQEIRFWQQSHSLLQSDAFYRDYDSASLFWWFSENAPLNHSCVPKPFYGSDGSKVFDVLDRTGCDLTRRLGPFPFFSFWGPGAGLKSSRWIAQATAAVMTEKQPRLTFCYLPHLDYDHQRLTDPPVSLVDQVDQAAGIVIDAADRIGATVVVVSEYGLRPVTRPVDINRALRRLGDLRVRRGPFGEQLHPGDCDAFAVADHQIAHVHVKHADAKSRIKRLVADIDGVDQVVDPAEVHLDHPRSGDLIAIAQPDSWFTYYHWLEDRHAPDYAATVDIHRKPGYDPVELFATSRTRAIFRVAQKKLGFRYRMDVIPLDPSLVGGSHGRIADNPEDGPLIAGPGQLPDRMVDFPRYVRGLLNATS